MLAVVIKLVVLHVAFLLKLQHQRNVLLLVHAHTMEPMVQAPLKNFPTPLMVRRQVPRRATPGPHLPRGTLPAAV